jgi:hypothetical protein
MEARRTVRLGAGASIVATLGLTASAQAATYEVDNLGDPGGAGNCTANAADCSLRQAVDNADLNPGDDSIVFTSGLTGSVALGSQIGIQPVPDTDRVTISGPGAGALTIQAGANTRVFGAYGATTLQGMTLTGGNPYGNGGAVESPSGKDLTLNGVAITSSHAKYGAGVEIFAGSGDPANLTITGSTISGNAADRAGIFAEDQGGGVGIGNNVSARISNSTIANNAAVYGGGVSLRGSVPSTLVVRDSTISGNNAVGSDVDGNGPDGPVGGYGGGIDAGPLADLRLYNSIVANNTSAPAPGAPNAPDLHGPAIVGASLIESPLGAAATAPPGFRIVAGIDPKLGPLQNNGGTTQTMKPDPTSVVVDGGGPSSTVDQRGLPRPVDLKSIKNPATTGANGADMGAVELTEAEGPAAKCKKKKKHKGKKKELSTAASAAKKHKKNKSCKKKHHKKHHREG